MVDVLRRACARSPSSRVKIGSATDNQFNPVFAHHLHDIVLVYPLDVRVVRPHVPGKVLVDQRGSGEKSTEKFGENDLKDVIAARVDV